MIFLLFLILLLPVFRLTSFVEAYAKFKIRCNEDYFDPKVIQLEESVKDSILRLHLMISEIFLNNLVVLEKVN